MNASLRALLTGIFDYAGLFPPARLPLEQAFPNYLRYREHPDSWMLAQFVMPAARLAELAPLVAQAGPLDRPITFSILGTSHRDSETWAETLQADFQAVADFLALHEPHVAAPAFEVALPVCEGEILEQVLEQALGQVREVRFPSPAVFFELPAGERWKERFRCAADLLASYAADSTSPQRAISPPGLKLRAGGLEAKAFPSLEEVAFAIHTTAELGIRWKATAGLHHPLRQHRAEVNTKMHGFLNLLVATVLANTDQLDQQQLAEILAEESPQRFRFESDALSFGDYSASREEIEHAREHGLVSIGSCSFDEPRDDLRELKWL